MNDMGDPIRFRCALLERMSKHDADAFRRLQVRHGGNALIRYLAAECLTVVAATAAYQEAYRKFGEAIEAAYQTLLKDLNAPCMGGE